MYFTLYYLLIENIFIIFQVSYNVQDYLAKKDIFYQKIVLQAHFQFVKFSRVISKFRKRSDKVYKNLTFKDYFLKLKLNHRPLWFNMSIKYTSKQIGLNLKKSCHSEIHSKSKGQKFRIIANFRCKKPIKTILQHIQIVFVIILFNLIIVHKSTMKTTYI